MSMVRPTPMKPKPVKQSRQRKGLRRIGRKTLEWERVRRDLKEAFNTAGITSCEIRFPQCWDDYCLYFSHTKRRNDITSEEELRRVVLACAPCATACTAMGKVKEEQFLESIIAARATQP